MSEPRQIAKCPKTLEEDFAYGKEIRCCAAQNWGQALRKVTCKYSCPFSFCGFVNAQTKPGA
jgi:hypothetical protein